MQPPSSAVSNVSFRPSVMRRDSGSETKDPSFGLNNLQIRNE